MTLTHHPRRAPRGAAAAIAATLLLAALAGCSDDKETMASWAQKGGKDQTVTIAQDVKTVIQESEPSSRSADHCRQVLADVKAARAYHPMPDQGTRTVWNESLDRLDTAATTCVHNAEAGTGGASLQEAIAAETSYRSFADSYGRQVNAKP
ncbi:hypothetical protein [Kitasatospora sp. NPDC094015]|uniref:hypothetical protein n=1 Tax=Kitasatospora sp. NPDC094015 TaxID=3155205 RepID=UPI0033280EA6